MSGTKLAPILKTFGFMQLLPLELEGHMVMLRSQLTNYVKCKTWTLDQVAARAKVAKSREIAAMDKDASGEDRGDRPSQEEMEMLAVWRQKGDKAGSKGLALLDAVACHCSPSSSTPSTGESQTRKAWGSERLALLAQHWVARAQNRPKLCPTALSKTARGAPQTA